MYEIIKTSEFSDWLDSQTVKLRALVLGRIIRIKEFGHFGDAKNLGGSLAELKWANGTRVYFFLRTDEYGNWMIILIGGNKNSQRSDIKVARKLLRGIINEKV